MGQKAADARQYPILTVKVGTSRDEENRQAIREQRPDAVTAAAHPSPLIDYADLDGNLLIDDDPFRGVQVENGKLIRPDVPGLGLQPAR